MNNQGYTMKKPRVTVLPLVRFIDVHSVVCETLKDNNQGNQGKTPILYFKSFFVCCKFFLHIILLFTLGYLGYLKKELFKPP